MAELGQGAFPRCATRQTCGAYLQLLQEVQQLLDLKRRVAAKQVGGWGAIGWALRVQRGGSGVGGQVGGVVNGQEVQQLLDLKRTVAAKQVGGQLGWWVAVAGRPLGAAVCGQEVQQPQKPSRLGGRV